MIPAWFTPPDQGRPSNPEPPQGHTGQLHVDANHIVRFVPLEKGRTLRWPLEAALLLVRYADGNIHSYNRSSQLTMGRLEDATGYAFVSIREREEIEAEITRESEALIAKASKVECEEVVRTLVEEEILLMRQKGYDWSTAERRIIDHLRKSAELLAARKLKDALK